LALAVVVSGAGVGMFIAGPLVQALLNLYGLQGTFLVLAAISANHLVLGMKTKGGVAEKPRPVPVENTKKKVLQKSY
jgi:predicted MFS family arabinose efflux permease